MHLFLYGNSGVGKSTLIREVFSELGVAPAGFFSRKMPGEREGAFRLNLNPAMAADYSAASVVAEFSPESGWNVDAEKFDRLGLAALREIPAGGVVLLDELGMLERGAHAFRARVLSILSELPCRAVGVIKEKGDGFLESLKALPQMRVLEMTADNRDEIKAALTEHLRPRALSEALGIRPGVTAIVGGGGKTTAMLRLAKELSREHTCIVGTTTHIFPPELPTLIEPTAEEVKKALQEQNLICVGAPAKNGKFGAVNGELLKKLPSLAEYVVLEADGSRGLPLKAPAGHEPVIPENTTHVIAVAGMDGANRPIREVCHRPNLYAELLGTDQDHTVTPAEIAKALAHRSGQYKNVNCAFSVILNKSDSMERFRAARAAAAAFPGTAIIAGMQREPSVYEIWRDGICLW